MWNRQELKLAAKGSFQRNYWTSVLVAFIYSLFFGASSAITFSNTRKNLDESDIDFSNLQLDNNESIALLLLIFGGIGLALVIAYALKLFVFNPLNVGCNRFFIVNQFQKASAGELGFAFKNNYGNSVVAILVQGVIIGLGYCLFIIPGVILTYSYRMVPYILADEPQLGAVQVLKKSRAMMKGNKWRSFVYDLSFIGWFILGALTCNILKLFYVDPYFQNAKAALYIAIRDEYNGNSPQNVVNSI